jgi:DNA mismatch repair protein MutS2
MTEGWGDEIDLHRLTVDQALPVLSEFLYEAYRYGLREVVVVHGKGTGILRKAVRRFLDGHTLVRRHHEAPSDRGGAGATRALLCEE